MEGPLPNVSLAGDNSSLAVDVCACVRMLFILALCNLQIETNNSRNICNYGKRVFTK